MRRRRIALFADASPFYARMLASFARAFTAIGWEASIGLGLLPGETLETLRAEVKLDVILEVNRSRTHLPQLSTEVVHVAWFQDHHHRILEQRSESELTYFIFDPNALGYAHELRESDRILSPGCDTVAFHPRDPVREDVDFAIVGFIPAPFPASYLERELVRNDDTGAAVTALEVIQELVPELGGVIGEYRSERLRERVVEIIHRRTGISLDVERIPDAMLAAFDKHLVRITERQLLLAACTSVSRSIAIYGPETWRLWPDFVSYYRGELHRNDELRAAYRAARLVPHANVHGWGMHFRTLECMASGGTVLVLDSSRHDGPGGLHRHFAPGEHFVPITFADFAERARELLDDPGRRQRIGRAAARAVAAGHTWRHRAAQVAGDLVEIL